MHMSNRHTFSDSSLEYTVSWEEVMSSSCFEALTMFLTVKGRIAGPATSKISVPLLTAGLMRHCFGDVTEATSTAKSLLLRLRLFGLLLTDPVSFLKSRPGAEQIRTEVRLLPRISPLFQKKNKITCALPNFYTTAMVSFQTYVTPSKRTNCNEIWRRALPSTPGIWQLLRQVKQKPLLTYVIPASGNEAGQMM